MIGTGPLTRLAASALLLITWGCGVASDAGTAGYLVVGIATAPNGFDPRLTADEGSERVAQLVYSRLLELDDTLRPVPALAERLDRLDPLTWVVTLRDGVRFHDGRPLTSADVVYTLRSIMDPATASPLRGAYRAVTGIEALDARAVRITTAEPMESFPAQLVVSIVPEGSGPGLRTAPIGSGPYRFVESRTDDRIVLARFDGYFRGPAANPGVVLRILPDDTMRGLELRHGSVDVVINDIPPDLVHGLREGGTLRVITAPGTDYSYIGLNVQDPVLRDARLRRALALAVDRDGIVTYLRRALATPAAGMLPPGSWAAAPDLPTFAFDPAAARRALDDAGYPDPDGAGPRPRLRLTLTISTNELTRLQATVLQENFRAVGVEVEVRQHEFATLFADVVKGNFQMVTLQWVGGAVADPDILRRVFHSNQIPPGGFNRGRYRNADVDRLLDLAGAASGEERRRLYQAVQRRIAEDQPYISLWHRTNVAVLQPWVEGLSLGTVVDFERLARVRRGAPGARRPGRSVRPDPAGLLDHPSGVGRERGPRMFVDDAAVGLLRLVGLPGCQVRRRHLHQQCIGRQRRVLRIDELTVDLRGGLAPAELGLLGGRPEPGHPRMERGAPARDHGLKGRQRVSMPAQFRIDLAQAVAGQQPGLFVGIGVGHVDELRDGRGELGLLGRVGAGLLLGHPSGLAVHRGDGRVRRLDRRIENRHRGREPGRTGGGGLLPDDDRAEACHQHDGHDHGNRDDRGLLRRQQRGRGGQRLCEVVFLEVMPFRLLHGVLQSRAWRPRTDLNRRPRA